MKKLEFIEGDAIGDMGLSYIREDYIYREKGGLKRRKCIFMCHCGNEFSARLADVRRNKRTSCGCKKGNKPKLHKKGDLINGVIFIKSLGTKKYAQRAIFKCPLCGENWESLVANVHNGNSKSCCSVGNLWSKEKWCALSDKAILYKVELFNEKESFIKIGITTKTVKERLKYIPYDYVLIKEISGESSYIYDLEIRIKRKLKRHRYIPLTSFKGDSECFYK